MVIDGHRRARRAAMRRTTPDAGRRSGAADGAWRRGTVRGPHSRAVPSAHSRRAPICTRAQGRIDRNRSLHTVRHRRGRSVHHLLGRRSTRAQSLRRQSAGLAVTTAMKRIMAVASVIVALSAQLSSGNQVAPSGVDVYFDADSQLVLGEPLIVRSTIRNRSAESVDINLGWNRKGAVRLRLRNPNGNEIDVPALASSGGVSRTRTVRIDAGSSYSQQYIIDEWISPEQIGTYTVTMTVIASVQGSRGPIVAAYPDNSFVVDVKPRDAATLQRRCGVLAIRATEESHASDRIDAAAALSYFKDPTAVSCIDTVLQKTTMFDSVLARGLMLIGTENARAVLEKMFMSDHDERHRIASDATRPLSTKWPVI